jgi:hypothetical protein
MDSTAVRRVVLTVAVALLVATAGCSGLGGGDGADGADGTNGTDGASGTDGGAGGTDGGDGGDGGDASGYGVAGGELDGTTLDNSTTAAVESAGSYTLTTAFSTNGTIQNQTYSTVASVTTSVDLEAAQGLSRTESTTTQGSRTSENTLVIYATSEGSYNRVGTGDNATYRTPDDRFVRNINVTSFSEDYSNLIDAIAWEQVGTETFQGTGVTRYNVTSVANATALVGGSGSVNEASGSMLVDEEGVVRQISLSLRYEQQGSTTVQDVTVTLGDIGSTSVSEPGWVSEAQSS